MTIEECIYQCEFNCKTLNSGCVQCDEKAKDFYQSVITYLKKYKKITLDNREYQNQKDLDYLYAKLDLLCPKGETSLSDLKLSTRSSNCLVRGGVKSVEQLEKISDDDLIKFIDLGKKTRREITINFNNWKKKKEEKEND